MSLMSSPASFYYSNCPCFSLCRLLTFSVQSIIKLLMTGLEKPQAGIMIPIPQYPLYTAIIAEFNAHPVSSFWNFYRLDVVDDEWSLLSVLGHWSFSLASLYSTCIYLLEFSWGQIDFMRLQYAEWVNAYLHCKMLMICAGLHLISWTLWWLTLLITLYQHIEFQWLYYDLLFL